jgi:uncharacterized protein with HEPN domain
MSRSWKLFLQDIIDSGSKVIRHTEQVSYEEFVSNEILYDAVIRNLEIIGEAAKKIPEDSRGARAVPLPESMVPPES